MTGTTKHRIWLVAAACAAVLTYQAPQATAVEPPGSPLVMPPQTSESSLVRGQTMLGNAQVALQNRDLVSAVGSYRQVAALAAQEPGLKANAENLRQILLQAGIDANMLPAVGAPATTGQQQVASLIAQARMAYDKGDIATAMQKTSQAKQIKLTPAESSAMRSAIGKLTLDVEAAAKRRATGSAGDMNPYPVQQAGATAPIAGATGSAGDIQRADYSSSNSGPAAATPAQATEPSRLSPPPGTESVGAQLYQQGVDALSAGNREEARRLFVQAWQHEAQLDSAIRSQLQAKLQLMQQPIASANNSQEALSPLDQVDQETLANRQRLYRQVTSELGVAYKDRIEKPLDALDRINQLRKNVVDADVDASAKQTLLAMVDRAIREQQKYVEENRADIELDIRNEQVRTDLENERSERLEIDDLIAEKVQTFDQLMSEQRFAEAQVIAKQVKALSPDSTIGTQMFRVSQIQVRRRIAKEIQDNNEDAFITQLQDAQNLDMLAPDQSVGFMDADEWASLSEARLGLSNLNDKMSPAEQEIKRLLSTEVDVKFRSQPLGEVLKTLEMVTGIPMFVDEKALAVARVDSSTPVTLDLTRPISLKSALDLILGQFELTYTIGNEVLQITTNEVKRGKMIVKTYKVADLVTPIPNFTTSYEDGLAGALRAAYQMTTASTNVQVMPVSAMGMHANAGGPQPALANQNPNVLAQYGNGMSPMMPGSGSNPMRGASGAGSLADFGSIMQLIQTTIAPETWEDTMGGPSTMAPYYQNLSLVISTTSDVHDQILELLASLRRLQNLQVTIEVRFISLSDSFFEQIGVDFDFSIDDNSGGILPADDSGSSVSVGLAGPNGQFTSDFDIKFANQNFNVSPIFGGVDPGALSTFGFAILSDIEAFFFIQAAQGDNRTNVMQAPKVTLFDGQSASIQDVSQRPFVTSISPVVGDFAVAQQPIIVVLNEGTELNVQAVVSDDKRFVRLTLVPFFSQIGDVDTFTYTGSSTTRSSSTITDPNTGEPVEEDEDERITQGSTVQLPTFAFTSVNTTVSVPDGGTILLGGIKRLREGRGERGLPIMSKLPYINRLFRNTAIGRDASSLMLMVTPRIIIQEEEEIAQTGFDPTR